MENISEQEKKDLLARSFESGVRYVDPLLDCADSVPRSVNQIVAGLGFRGELMVFDKSMSSFWSGFCAQWRDINMTQVNDVDMENLRHMLGIGSHIKKRQWGYRNHFAPGGADIQSMERLEAVVLVRKGQPYQETHYYHATEAGCVAAGLKPHQVRRAMVP
ncbi:hypothetical protein [Acidithiobacillus ferrivorans]|uniref:hypothetical protein n=1 Tax=Acidithiobacillus ferrivorans TaxID=160808 RepID=UPI001E65AE9C|nr:hypothetical protein [Acidithiobacillus ferrivorans]